MPSEEVYSLESIRKLRNKVRRQADRARQELTRLDAGGMESLFAIKFDNLGYQPVQESCLDFIEQLNQTFTVMVSLAAAEKLLECFPHCGGLRLNLGTASGRDIEGICPDVVEAEVFAAKGPRRNSKLKKDIDRLRGSNAAHQYVFFFCPSHQAGQQYKLEQLFPDSRAEIWALGRDEIM